MFNVKHPLGMHSVVVPAPPEARVVPLRSSDHPISPSQLPPPTVMVTPLPVVFMKKSLEAESFPGFSSAPPLGLDKVNEKMWFPSAGEMSVNVTSSLSA